MIYDWYGVDRVYGGTRVSVLENMHLVPHHYFNSGLDLVYRVKCSGYILQII